MKSTSADRPPQIRPANLGQQLMHSRFGPFYADPHLECLIEQAAERAKNAAQAEGSA